MYFGSGILTTMEYFQRTEYSLELNTLLLHGIPCDKNLFLGKYQFVLVVLLICNSSTTLY